MMKTYEVELRRTSFILMTVEAENEDDAEALAWKQIESGDFRHEDAQWEIESVERMWE
jgi:hypothetical protein